MRLSKERMLVITPHADDETYGCAGTMAKVKAEGGEVYVIVVTIGDVLQYQANSMQTNPALVRKGEFEKAMQCLGVDGTEIIFTDAQTHMRLDSLPRRDLVELFEHKARLSINALRPTIVALPALSYNQDHVAVFEAGFTACRPHLPAYKHIPEMVVAYESPHLSWNLPAFQPNCYVDISRYIETKMKAFRCYSSQIHSPLHIGSAESVADQARVRGRDIAVDAAEGFVIYRQTL